MPLFNRRVPASSRHRVRGSQQTYRFHLRSRTELLARYDLMADGIAHSNGGDIKDDRHRLARVLEEYASEGWRLVGISGVDFVFRSRV